MANPNHSVGVDVSPSVSHDVGSMLIYSEQHADLGIIRTVAEVFAVGSYRYTNLADAISQAKKDGAENE